MKALDPVFQPYSVAIQGGAWTVTYTEPSGKMVFSFELGIDREILWFPTREKWLETAPEWARDHRDMILERIIREFGSRGCEVMDELW